MRENFAKAGIRNLEMTGVDVLNPGMTMGTMAVGTANESYSRGRFVDSPRRADERIPWRLEMHRQIRNTLTGFMLLTGSVIAGPWSAPAAAQSGATPQVQTVQVKLKEWSLGMQTATIKAATARFEVENDGQYPHAFKLEGKLGNQSFELATPVLRAGEKSVLIVKLPPGTYEADCPVGDHEMRGMKNTVTFQKP